MALNEVISGDTPSATYTPTETVSAAMVEGNGRGAVYLEMQVPSGQWIGISSKTGAFGVSTPDPAVLYRFRPVGVQDPVRVYMGP